MSTKNLKRKLENNQEKVVKNAAESPYLKKKKKKKEKKDLKKQSIVKQQQSESPLPKVSNKILKKNRENASKIFLVPSNLAINRVEKEEYGRIEADFSSWNTFRTGKEIVEDEDLFDSTARSRQFFEWLIAPVSIDEFYENYWEKKPLLIKRKKPEYYTGWFTKKDMDELFKKNHLNYSQHVDVTIYEKGERKTLNPNGRATSDAIWKYFDKGCSIRMLHPQQYFPPISKMLSVLEDFWGCGGGCNSYLTPKGSQGFAPHYDDVEAFVIQTEGAKMWKLYAPREDSEILPRTSSPNFNQNEIGKPILECQLECGDMLYFPRGTIHQAISIPSSHSLHLTLSTGLQSSWADFLEIALPRAVQVAFDENQELRKSLPRDFFHHMGVMFSDSQSEQRQQYIQTMFGFLEPILTNLPYDSSADAMALGLVESRLPPVVHSSSSGLLGWNPNTRKVENEDAEINGKSYFTMVNANAIRVLVEDGIVAVYTPVRNRADVHANRNVKEEALCEEDIVVEFPLEESVALEHIVGSYPQPFRVSSIPIEGDDKKIEFVKKLFHHGILIMRTDVD
eukprot:TRINITY_DN1184_c0_g2_i1.p1 TRINITY_DN1184_c0_g2~~TRINITY_DN1184_c0_g2_i1.p1  ORF type:complete len:565 (+),score=218.65 TRINITY_DN1184_c0_g2_i1:95-1789(+)